MKNTGYFLFFTLIFSSFQSIHGQSRSVVGLFPTLDHSGPISPKLDYSFYLFGAHPLMNIVPKFEWNNQILLFYTEQAIHYHWTPLIAFSGAYVFQKERINREVMSNENRIHFQATVKYQKNRFEIKNRIRWDHRWIGDPNSDQIFYSHRFRFLTGIKRPLKIASKTGYLSFSEEFFLNSSKNSSALFGENWMNTALGIEINEFNKIESGPLYITWKTADRSWLHQYYFQLTWVSRIK